MLAYWESSEQHCCIAILQDAIISCRKLAGFEDSTPIYLPGPFHLSPVIPIYLETVLIKCTCHFKARTNDTTDFILWKAQFLKCILVKPLAARGQTALIVHQQRKKGLINIFAPEKAKKKGKKMQVWSSKFLNAYQLQKGTHIVDFAGQIYDSANVPFI